MPQIEQIRPNSNPIQGKLYKTVDYAVQAVITEHPNQLTYFEICGVLGAIQSNYDLERQATEMSEA